MILDFLETKEFRYERKFLIDELDKYEVEEVIKQNPFMFSKIFYERIVNNIYLDSIDLNSYYDNLIGISQRFKIRIRWYGKLGGLIQKPVLEIKIKNNDLGAKLSFPLNSFKIDKNLSMGVLIKEVISKSNLPQWLVEHIKSLKFALLNRYKRRYFMTVNKKYRVTLDFDLEFYRIHPINNLFVEQIKHEDYVILELKYGKNWDSDAEKITNFFPFRLTKNSKYVCGIESISF